MGLLLEDFFVRTFSARSYWRLSGTKSIALGGLRQKIIGSLPSHDSKKYLGLMRRYEQKQVKPIQGFHAVKYSLINYES